MRFAREVLTSFEFHDADAHRSADYGRHPRAKRVQHPAIGAGPFLTTTTDVLGFFSFLGLATLFLT